MFAGAHVLFDGDIEKPMSTCVRFRGRSDFVKNGAFENSVCKVQNGEENTLSAAAPWSQQFLLNLERWTERSQTGCSLLVDFWNAFDWRWLQKKLHYVDFYFVFATVNICKRLFLVAGFANNSRRKSVLPANIESRLFLNVNSTLRGIVDIHLMHSWLRDLLREI